MHLQLDDPEADIECRLVESARGVECRDDLLRGVLRRAVLGGVLAVGGDTQIYDFLGAWAAYRLTDVVFEAEDDACEDVIARSEGHEDILSRVSGAGDIVPPCERRIRGADEVEWVVPR